MDLVIGGDAGGTSTRCLLADATGRVLGTGTAAGLNQRSSGGDPVDRLVAALTEALAGADPSAVRGGVLGVAGAGAAGLTAAQEDADAAWARLGLGGSPVVVPDLLVAFAAGTPEPSGTVLVAGTGAGAAAVVDRRLVRQADAAGWLLGDIGSAVWLAREGLVAAVADLDGRGPSIPLTEPLLQRLLGRPGPYTAQDVIAKVYGVPPASLGSLAPVVTEHAPDIVERGVAGLLSSLAAVRTEGPVVLAGALLTHPGPVLDAVRQQVGEAAVATQPAAGAAWLALVALGVDNEAVHRSLVAGPR